MNKLLLSIFTFTLISSLHSALAAPSQSQSTLNKAIFEHSLHQDDDAQQSYKDAFDQAASKSEQIIALKGMGMLSMGQGKDDDAVSAFKQAADLESSSSNVAPATRAATLMNLGLAYTHLSRYAEADPIYKKALEFAEASNNKQIIANAYDHLAMFYVNTGSFEKADEASQKAVDLAQHAWGADSVNAACMMANRGYALALQGRYREAEAYLKEALAIDKEKLGDENCNVSGVLADLGRVYMTQGKLPEAESMFLQSIKIRSKVCGQDDPGLLGMQSFLARTYLEEGKIENARQTAEKSLRLAETRFGNSDHKIFLPLLTLATVAERTGDYSKAMSMAERAYQLDKTNHKLLLLFSKLYQGKGDLKRADLFGREAVTQCENQFGKNHSEVARCAIQLASVLKQEKQIEESSRLEKRAEAIKQRIVRLNASK